MADVISTAQQVLARLERGAKQLVADKLQLEQANHMMNRLNRELRAISNCSQVLMRAVDEPSLLNDICRIVADVAGYPLVWVGYPADDPAKTVRPVAWAGTGYTYLTQVPIVSADTDDGRNPTGTAIRDGVSASMPDIAATPSAAAWRALAVRNGFRACLGLPLKNNQGAVLGAFTVYSSEPNAFTPDEIRLMEELAGDLAFGIVALRDRKERTLNDAVNASRLRLIEFAATHSLDDLLEETLNEAEALSGSVIGFYHFVDDDQTSLTLQNWSTRTKSMFCKAAGKGQHYPISKAGVWVECVVTGKAVIHNDYASLPNRKGLPEGHAMVTRELVVPVFRDKKIKAILGVGNKLTDYQQKDAETVSLLADLAWEIAERKRAEDALRGSEQRLIAAQRIAQLGNWELDLASNHLTWSDEIYRIFEIAPDRFGASYEAFLATIHPDDREMVNQAYATSLKSRQPYDIVHRLQMPDGRIKYVNERCETYYGATGEPLRSIGTVHDITERKLADDALRLGEEKYRTLIQKLQTAVVVHAPDTRIVTCNATAQSLLGLSEDQMMGKSAMDPAWHFFREDGTLSPLEEYPVNQTLATGQPLRNRIFGVHRPGRGPDVWVMVNANPVFDHARQISEVIVTFNDVTEWKQAQEKLTHLAAIVESSEDAIIGKTLDETIVSWNRGAERIYGYRASEMVGCPISLLVPVGLEAELAAIVARLRGGETIEHLETSRVRKDGQIIQVALTISPIKNASGEITGASTIARDITERKRAEAEIRQLNSDLEQRVRDRTRELAVSEERMRLFFERQLMGAAITSPEKTWLQVNDKLCQMLGYSREELTQLTWADLTFPEDLAADVAQFERLLKGAIEGYTLEKRFVRKDGSLVFTNLAVACVRRLDRSVDYFLAMMEDITERKRAEASIQRLNDELRVRAAMLEAANKELESFSYSVSHDLRAPLRSMDGFSRALLADYGDKLDPEGKENLRTIRASSQKMGRLIEDLLRLSQLSRGELHLTQVDLSSLVEQVAADLKQSEPGRNVEFVIAPSCVAQGDAGLLAIAVENIVRNAWKYTGKKPAATIEFGVHGSADGTVFFVRDNGCGFDQKYAGRLFGAFQRLHTTSEYPGTGVGLASVQRIIHRHGGRVWIEAKVDEGTTLSFTLPSAPSNP